MIACVAIIGKDNEPMYFRCFVEGNRLMNESVEECSLRLQYHVHASLDVIEEKLRGVSKANAATPLDSYMGLLLSLEDYKIYGCATNARTKFVIVFQDSGSDAIAKAVLRDLNSLYVTLMCNPFVKLNAKIESPKFDANVNDLISASEKRCGAASP